MEIISLLFSTVVSRPYVFFYTFIALIIAYYALGIIRTIFFWVISYSVAFLCEYSSTRNGFPFGLYHYIHKNPHELYVSNVPFWDSLSFAFLAFTSFIIAKLITHKSRRKVYILFLAPALLTFVDIIVDPIANLGERWFLGKIYYYEYPGIYFGVPISNFSGWYFVGFVTIGIFQLITNIEVRNALKVYRASIIFYFILILFHIGVAFYIDEPLLGFIDILLFIPLAYWIIKSYRVADGSPT